MGIFTRFRDPNVIFGILGVASLIVAILAWRFPVIPSSQVLSINVPAYLYFAGFGIVVCSAVAWIAFSRQINHVVRRAPDFSDALTDNTNGYNWTEIIQPDGSCVFRSNGYHITTLDLNYRFYKGLSREIVLIYYFYIRTDGIFGFEKGEERRIPVQHRVLERLPNNNVNKGLNQQNRLKVRALGHVIDLYVNEQFLARIDDSPNPHLRGYMGFASGPNPSEVIFSNLKVWKIN